MKHLILRNTNYINLENGFADWLETLGYARSTVDGSPKLFKSFFLLPGTTGDLYFTWSYKPNNKKLLCLLIKTKELQ